MQIQPHLQAQLERKGEASPALFENRKNSPDFGKKGPNYDHLWDNGFKSVWF